MAIVNSLAVGKASKTAGELTFAKVRGRTIARRRIINNKSNTVLQQAQRHTFSIVSTMAAMLDQYIKANFTPTEYGSARNCFIKKNWPFLKQGYSTEVPSEMTLENVLFDVINSGAYVQYGVGIEGSLIAEINTSNRPHFNLQLIDKNYTSVSTGLISVTSGAFSYNSAVAQPRLNNGVWSVDIVGSYEPNVGDYYILCVFVDGKPIINNTGGIIKTE